MAEIVPSRKSASVNPLKMSAPLGAAMAYLGLDACMPLFHGSQGCTAFGLVLLVRHFREAIPFQTTAMNEVTTILGGIDNLEQAVLNISKRANPKVIGIATTGLTETRGEDLRGDLKLIRQRHPELADLALVYASTPDFQGALQDGWAAAVKSVIEQLVERPTGSAIRGQVNILAGSHLTPGDIEEIRDLVEAFELTPIILPDISGSLDGHVPADYVGASLGGTTIEEIRAMGRSEVTLVLGSAQEPAAQLLKETCGVPFRVFHRLTGLLAVDEFVAALMEISGRQPTSKIRRQRSQLQDAMLDGHFFFGGLKVALAAEPDLLYGLGAWLADMGAEIAVAVTSTDTSREVLAKLPAETVLVGDLDDWEQGAVEKDCGLLITHAHGRQAAERLGLPFHRAGFPMFDRLGAAHKVSVGYRGTRELIFEVGNLLLAQDHHPTPDSWRRAGEGAHAQTPAH